MLEANTHAIWTLTTGHPEEDRAALETALDLESYHLASKQRVRLVRDVQLEKEHPVTATSLPAWCQGDCGDRECSPAACGKESTNWSLPILPPLTQWLLAN